MKIEVNKIITLGNKEKYLVVTGVTHNNNNYYYIAECNDNEDDIKTLPVSSKVGIGSRALVIPTGNIYMFSPSKKWVKYSGVSILN